ncbi:conserved hypothetical protein [Ricinus communis]|uniref:Uncharacterized protein n=2 Tax=Ricinus communis TaxID=3988 RepID=B9SDQ2_RICCO|nr:conserved hypothetical protein [Ricinus communis]
MATKPHYEGRNDIEELKDSKGWLLKPGALNIVWGNDNRYWSMPTGSGTR